MALQRIFPFISGRCMLAVMQTNVLWMNRVLTQLFSAQQHLVFLLVSVCCDTAQALVFLLVSACCDSTQALVFLLVSVCCDSRSLYVLAGVSVL